MPIQIDLGHSSGPSAPKKIRSGPVVGIDLGTTNSLIALAQGSSAPRVFEIEPGETKLPSVVAFTNEGIIEAVGQRAQSLRTLRPEQVVYSAKRLMGRSLKDLEAQRHLIPYELVNDELSSQALIKIGDVKISPVEISAFILRELKKAAETALGQSIERAVITVPAYFDDAQRSATKAAGRLAGLEILRVFNEPTAAALAFGWSSTKPGKLAVYDLGGGTFDISILRIEENVYEVLSTAGDTHLGGDDFDQILAEHALGLLAERHPELKPASDEQRRTLLAELLREAERAKIKLTNEASVSFTIRGHAIDIDQGTVHRLWQKLIDATLMCCKRALEDAQLKASDLDDVLLVGGSTRMGLVRKEVEKFFGRSPNTSLNPDEAVALGAAMQGEVLSGNSANERLLLDVIPLSLGLETMGGAVTKLISRNSTLPFEAREVFTNHAENQTAFDIHVVQGERELVEDCRSLARFKLRGLEPAPTGFHRIEVLFRIDANGILNVRARDLRSGKFHEIEVRPSFGMSDEQIERMLEASFENAEKDVMTRQLLDLRIEVDTVLQAGDKAIVQAGHLVSPRELSEIKSRLGDLRNSVHSAPLDKLRNALDEFNAVTGDLAELQVNDALKRNLQGRNLK